MLQVYAHAASLNGNEYAVTSSASAAAVKYRGCELNISISAKNGVANWQLTQADRQDQGTFQIDDNGILIFPDGPKELDTAAIDWIGQLGKVPGGRRSVAQDVSPG